MVRVDTKFAAAGAVLLLGLAAGMTEAYAAPRNSDCVNCTPRSRYDSDEVIQKIRNSRASADSAPAATRQSADRDSGPRLEPIHETAPLEPIYEAAPRADATYREEGARTETRRGGGSRPEPAYRERVEECRDCPPPKKYDSEEVVKSSHDVDKSRVVNTVTVVPVAPRYREHNHLIVHENETRLTGTVQHNNLIVEKEIRYVRRAPIYRPHYEVRRYRPVVQTQLVYVPIIQRQSGCGCNIPPPPPVQSCGNCGGVQVGYYGYGYGGY
jgi:hypothetical protein